FYSANTVQVRAFYAMKDMITPVRVSAAMVGLNLTLNMTLVWFFQEAGIAAATAISGVGSFLTLRYFLKKKLPDLADLNVSRTVVLS
ncbi:MAG: lipid II flippase MurJ, partial [Planctomycetota bacterium]|nr:lipid II flippase MurJ [Planctomycetota bacterium]